KAEIGRLVCAAGHSFDIARQGHVNLSGSAPPPNADTPAMVAARDRLLSSGAYDPIADALAHRLRRVRRLVEVGAGTGHYAARVLDAAPEAVGLATDVSPAAARRAARAHERLASVVADTWGTLPLRSASVDAVLCVFAPRNPAEFARILARGGLLVVVTPNPGHLAELREACGLLDIPDDKSDRLHRSLAGAFEPVVTTRVSRTLTLGVDALTDLIDMGPNAFHEPTHPDEPMEVALDVQLTVYRRPSPQG
ncbi:MAG TPA: methyltransferase domain-containing protein, partial [Propionibacteriaceae bacterium]|nr:methyltransferase domain-containing protein [Propionibacteriaceae bacterium]